MRGGGGPTDIWDSEVVNGAAFHPRKCQPNTQKGPDGAGWTDGEVPAADGVPIAYRLYVAGGYLSTPKPLVLLYFHANAELCTDLETEIRLFYGCGFHAVLCAEFRGFAWSGGKPRLAAICPDAEAVLKAAPELLSRAGFQAAESAVLVAHGRSLGSAAAVYVAARHGTCNGGRVAALVVESGVMSLLELPMVRQLGAMMPEMLQVLRSRPCPVETLAAMRQVRIPTLIIHGDRDEISPVEQAVSAHRACASAAKKLARYPRCRHNDLRAVAGREYFGELRVLCQVASGEVSPEALLAGEGPDGAGLLALVAGAFRCLPGVRRCLNGEEEDVERPPHGGT